MKKVVWAHVTIELEVTDGVDDESTMDYVNEELTDNGFIVDDMGILDNEEDKA